MKKSNLFPAQLLNYHYIKTNPLLLVIFSLIAIGIYFIFNSTVVLSIELFKNPYRFGLFHIAWVVVGIILFGFFFNLNLYSLRKHSFKIFFIAFLFLFFLFIARFFDCGVIPFAPCVNGAVRWFAFNPNPLPEIPIIGRIQFQPSELAKLALVVYVSFLFTKETLKIDDKIKKIGVVTALIGLLVFFQPNKSTAFILFSIVFAMYLTYGQKLKYLIYMIPILALIFIFFIITNSYSLKRVETFLDLSSNKDQNYHQEQIMISLGSGGFFGVGLGMSRQKFSFLPEIFSDSIFAVIGEESGFIGAVIVASLIFYLVYLGYYVASKQSDMYHKLLGVGITTWVGVQALVNLFAMVSLIPLTGVPLPLISYGGSSTIFLMIGLGILCNISKNIYERKFR
jgi:cell division protein FtsW